MVAGAGWREIYCTAVLALGCCSGAGMDRWAALSQIESGDRDGARGVAGEVSRYQIKPRLWRRYASADADWTRREDALAVAQAVMKQRCAEFERSAQRPPTDFEFYILWNAPAQIRNPGKAVRERAERFCNLVRDSNPGQKTD